MEVSALRREQERRRAVVSWPIPLVRPLEVETTSGSHQELDAQLIHSRSSWTGSPLAPDTMSASPTPNENERQRQCQLVGGNTDNDDRSDRSRGRHESEEPQSGIPARGGAHRDDRSTSPDRRRSAPSRTPFEDDNLSSKTAHPQSEPPLRVSAHKRIGPASREELVRSSADGGQLAQAPGDVDMKEAVTYGAAPSLALPVTLEGLEHPYNWPAWR